MLGEGNRVPMAVVASFICLNLLAFGDLETTLAMSLNSSSSSLEEEPGFSWDIATDNVAAYSVIPMLDLESLVAETYRAEHHGSSRQKRASKRARRVFRPVTPSDITTAPYSGAVRISNKCSGTLISDYHVLTAAHCVHTGRQFKPKVSQLKVGIVKGIGRFLWMKVSHIHIPKAWKKARGSRKKNTPDSDYAVLRLKHKHGQTYFRPQASKDRLGTTIKFNGFPGNKRGALWHSSCPVELVYTGNLLLGRCTASQGSSGSGLYVSRGFGKYAVTGVVSANMKVTNRRLTYTYVIMNKLTSEKVKKICRWTGRYDC